MFIGYFNSAKCGNFQSSFCKFETGKLYDIPIIRNSFQIFRLFHFILVYIFYKLNSRNTETSQPYVFIIRKSTAFVRKNNKKSH